MRHGTNFFDMEIYLKREVYFRKNESTVRFSTNLLDQNAFIKRNASFLDRDTFIIKLDLLGRPAICFPLLLDSFVESFKFSAFSEEIGPPWERSANLAAVSVWEDNAILYSVGNSFDAVYITEKAT